MSKESVSQRDIYNAIKDLRGEILVELKDVRNDVEELKDFKSKAYGMITIVSLFASGLFAFIWSKIVGE